MTSEEEMKRLYWHSRRGMLELDLILIPFVTERLPAMDARYVDLYRELLAEEDQDLYAWLVGRTPPSEKLSEIISVIIS